MGRALSTFAIVGAAFAFFAALILSSDATFILGVIGITASVFMIREKEMPGYVLGGATIVLSLLGLMGILSSISIGSDTGEAGGLGFGIPTETGRAILIAAMMMPTATMLWSRWGEMTPWVQYVGAVAAGLTVITAFGFSGDLGDQSSGGGFAVALFAIASSLPAVLAMRD